MKVFFYRYVTAVVFAAVFIFSSATIAVADGLTYKPINPNFGGNPLNGSYLLGNAGVQKQYSAPEKDRPSSVDQFAENLQRGLLSKISRDLSEMMLGENGKDSGSFSVGDTHVDFHRDGDNVIINIADAVEGASTTIELPVPGY